MYRQMPWGLGLLMKNQSGAGSDGQAVYFWIYMHNRSYFLLSNSVCLSSSIHMCKRAVLLPM